MPPTKRTGRALTAWRTARRPEASCTACIPGPDTATQADALRLASRQRTRPTPHKGRPSDPLPGGKRMISRASIVISWVIQPRGNGAARRGHRTLVVWNGAWPLFTGGPMRRCLAFVLCFGCGTGAGPVGEASESIVGGVIERRFASVGEIVYIAPDGRRTGVCSGTLMSPTMFISAAHCFYLRGQHRPLSLSRQEVAFRSAAGQMAVPIRKVFIHPTLWHGDLFAVPEDVAVAILDEPVMGIPPVPLARADRGCGYLSVGYGLTETGLDGRKDPPEKRSVGVCLEDVSEYRGPLYSRSIASTCAATGHRRGDSGGPLLDAALRLVGVVYGARDCGGGEQKSVYESVVSQKSFICGVAQGALPDFCGGGVYPMPINSDDAQASSRVGGMGASNAVDMLPSTKWAAKREAPDDPVWLNLSMGEDVLLQAVRTSHAEAAGEWPVFNLERYEIRTKAPHTGDYEAVLADVHTKGEATAHTQWPTAVPVRNIQLRVLDPGIDAYVRLPMVEIFAHRSHPSLRKLSHQAGVEAFTSSVYGPDWGPERAQDGAVTQSSKWASAASGTPEWLAFDLGHPRSVKQFLVVHAEEAGEYPAYNLSRYRIQVATAKASQRDQIRWETVFEGNNALNEPLSWHRLPTAKRTRFVRLLVLDPGDDDIARVPEFAVYGDAAM